MNKDTELVFTKEILDAFVESCDRTNRMFELLAQALAETNNYITAQRFADLCQEEFDV